MFDVPQHISPVAALIPSSTADVLRIVIAADPAARETLGSIAGSFDDLLVLDELEADEALASRLGVLTPDVLLCEVGRDAAPLAQIARLATPSLLLVGTAAQRSGAIAAGARGVIDRNATPRRIHAALHAVAEGLRVVDGERIADPRAEEGPLDESLTARELDVLQLLTAGMTNKEIAQRLGITEHTVKFHVNAILGKLHAETRTEAVVSAARRGIVVL